MKGYWDNTLYKDLKEKEIKQPLSKYVLVPLPKDITNKVEAGIWYIRMSELREKGKPFGDYHWTMDEKGL